MYYPRLNGLGAAPIRKGTFSAGALQQLERAQRIDLLGSAAFNEAIQNATVTGDVGPGGPAASSECDCLAEAYIQAVLAGGADPASITPDVRGQILAACVSDPDAVKAAIKQLGGSVEGCKPWYLRRNTLLLGGGVVAALVLWKVVR